MLSETDTEDLHDPSIRSIYIERNNSQCGFQLTRGRWDPYPWVSVVEEGTAASTAGLKPGDCLLEVNGEDIVGKRIREVAEMVKTKTDVSLLLWNSGVHSNCTPEALCCGPLPRNLQRLSACMSTILAFLECPVCLDTIPPPTYQCENGHLICIKCRTKTEKCPVCRVRLHRGRSLISDQIYNSIIDAFNLKNENDTMRTTRIQEIFKHRKKPNVPNIKVTPSYTNKFLAKIVGKSSSVDNLSTNTNSNDNLFSRIKSLSTNEIFMAESPAVSRSGSISRISRKDLNIINSNYEKAASCHGSYESLSRKTELAVPQTFEHLRGASNLSYYCPFSNNCTAMIEGRDIFEHFQVTHSDNGPLVQYFKPNLTYSCNYFDDQSDTCRVIIDDQRVYFLKTTLLPPSDEREQIKCSSQDILIWGWFLGTKDESKSYEVIVEVKCKNSNEVLLRVGNSVFSLNAVSAKEILDFKKGIFLSSKTLAALGFYTKEVLINVKIVKSDI